MTTLHFAQISDLHINHTGNHHDVLAGESAGFVQQIVSQLNQLDDLDFVLISGDLVDRALPEEIADVEAALAPLKTAYYVIPGNHDRREQDSDLGWTRRDFAQHFNPQFDQRPQSPNAQAGYWSVSVKPTIQLIGLDSIRDEDWGGIVDDRQMDWLAQELARHGDKLIILTIHHPLHRMSPVDDLHRWRFFVADNAPQILNLLADYPQVKLVLTGHHHLTKADWLGKRLHLACPAVAIYPCAYRTIRLTSQSDGSWQVEWQTHPATDEATTARAKQMMQQIWQHKGGLDPAMVAEIIELAHGQAFDRAGQTILT